MKSAHLEREEHVKALIETSMEQLAADCPGLSWRFTSSMGDQLHLQIWVYERDDLPLMAAKGNLAAPDADIVKMLAAIVSQFAKDVKPISRLYVPGKGS